MFKILFIAAAFCFLSFYRTATPSHAHPYLDKLELEATLQQVIAAILDEDVDALMELSHYPGSFQFGKKDEIEKLLKNYFDRIIETRQIDLQGIELKSDTEAEAMIRVYIFDRKGTKGMDMKPRDEVWSFEKVKEGSKGEKWLFLLGGTRVTNTAPLP